MDTHAALPLSEAIQIFGVHAAIPRGIQIESFVNICVLAHDFRILCNIANPRADCGESTWLGYGDFMAGYVPASHRLPMTTRIRGTGPDSNPVVCLELDPRALPLSSFHDFLLPRS